MEAELREKENALFNTRDNTKDYAQRVKEAQEQDYRRKQFEMANARASQVAQVKVERERLEQERQRIMQQLNQV